VIPAFKRLGSAMQFAHKNLIWLELLPMTAVEDPV
jgi:hypothetical protein